MLLLLLPTSRIRLWVDVGRIVAFHSLLARLTMMSPEMVVSSRWCPGRDAWCFAHNQAY